MALPSRFKSFRISFASILGFTMMVLMIPFQQLHAQQQSVEFVQYFRDIQNDFIRERVYLHTDRQWYVHGDRIWFSAFVTAGPQNLPSAISSVLYVELFDPEGSLVERVPVRIESGRASGSLTFNNTEPATGTYRIQAYTAWAKNFGEPYIHKADVAVISDEETDESSGTLNGAPDLQFFAEGGEMIAGLSQRVAFKAIGNDGLSRQVSGWVYSHDRSDMVRFASEHSGMGVIENWVSEEPGAFAIADIDGETVRKELPAPLPNGSMLRVDGNLADFLVTVRSNEPETQNGQLLLFAHVRGEIYYASLLLMENGEGETAISKNLFPTGIVHFTLLGPGGNPVSERLSFNENDLDRIESELQLEQETYSLRDEVALDLAVSDGESVLIPARVSLSVFDDAYANYQQYATDIRSRLYLESEIRGYIENPGYYFSDEPQAKLHLDYLLLAQGWRSYDMQAVLQRDNITLFSLPEDGFSLTGTIKSGFRGRPLDNATVAFSLDDNEENLDIVTTGPDGKFMISGLGVSGAASFVLRANNEGGSDRVQIELDNQFSNLEDSVTPPADHLTEVYFNRTDADDNSGNIAIAIDSLTERSQSARAGTERFLEAEMFGELDEITVTGERDEIDEEEQFRRFGERPSQRLDFDEQEHLSTLPINIVLNQIPGVNVVGNQVQINTGFTNLGGAGQPSPLILVDNIETDASYLLSLSPADVKTINVFRRSVELASFGISGTGGVISVRTRLGESGYVTNERGTLARRIQGYQQPTQFYSPRYGITVPRDIEEPDERITLHWEGDLTIPETGGTLLFWTNDVPSRYRVVLQGITQNGVPFSATQTFDVTE